VAAAPVAITVLLVFAMPGSASAEVQRFHRFEAIAPADYTVIQQCSDGSTVQKRVTVIGGHEEETESGVSTLDSDFLTVLIRGFNCDGIFANQRGSGPAEFEFSPSLQTASVKGTVTTQDGRSVTVDMSWEGTGAVETTNDTTTVTSKCSYRTACLAMTRGDDVASVIARFYRERPEEPSERQESRIGAEGFHILW
jgi:hypothetical protein